MASRSDELLSDLGFVSYNAMVSVTCGQRSGVRCDP
jgi:hypothetical protein